MDSCTHLSSIPSFSIVLVVTRYPEIVWDITRILCSWYLAALFRLNNPMNNSSHLSGIRSSLVDHMSHKILRMKFDLPKILCNLLLWKVLRAGIMVNSIFLVISVDILCLYRFESLHPICCECSKSSIRS